MKNQTELKQHIAVAYKKIIKITGCRTIINEDRNDLDNKLIRFTVVMCNKLQSYFIDSIVQRSIPKAISFFIYLFTFTSLWYNPLFDIRDGHCCWSVNMHVVTCYKRATIFFSLLPYVTFARKNKTGYSCYGCNNNSWF